MHSRETEKSERKNLTLAEWSFLEMGSNLYRYGKMFNLNWYNLIYLEFLFRRRCIYLWTLWYRLSTLTNHFQLQFPLEWQIKKLTFIIFITVCKCFLFYFSSQLIETFVWWPLLPAAALRFSLFIYIHMYILSIFCCGFCHFILIYFNL